MACTPRDCYLLTRGTILAVLAIVVARHHLRESATALSPVWYFFSLGLFVDVLMWWMSPPPTPVSAPITPAAPSPPPPPPQDVQVDQTSTLNQRQSCPTRGGDALSFYQGCVHDPATAPPPFRATRDYTMS